MLRLNKFLISKHLNKLSNALTKSSYYYSSEPPDRSYSIGLQSTADRTKRKELKVDISDQFLRRTNPELNLFGPHDRRAPLNGNIGLNFENSKQNEFQVLVQLLQKIPSIETIDNRNVEIESFLSNCYQSRCQKFFRILKYQKLFPQEMQSLLESAEGVDCIAQEMSGQLIKKFAPLFQSSKRQQLSDGLTVLTLSQKTINDMSGYSEEVELEREEFFEMFVKNADNVCKDLQSNGFWADFIDPYSGQPFFSERTNDTLYETDDRFVHLGFKIEDLGCCKAIYHKEWATHVIVGIMFTSAPANSPVLKKLANNCFSSK